MPDITRLLSAIESEESGAYGADNDSLNTERAISIDYYLGRSPEGNGIADRSQVVSQDVKDTIEWQKPPLIRIFTAGDTVVKFDPTGPEDEQAAEQETDYVNYIVTQKNNWFQICYEWISDALLTRNAYAMAYWEDKVDSSLKAYQGLTDDQLALIMQEAQSGRVEIVGHSQYPAQGLPPQQVQDPLTGQVVVLPPPNLHDIQFRVIKSYGCVRISVLPPERCLVSSDTTSVNLTDSPFFEYWENKTISSLREMGFDVPDNIPDDHSDADSEVDISRDVGATYGYENELRRDKSMRKVKVRMVWIRYDYNEDGIAELLQCVVVGKQVLRMDEVETIPVACIVPTIMPHRHIGLSTADDVAEIQDIKSAILRRGLDNLYLQTDGRIAASEKVNLDDLMTSRPGGVVRVAGGASPGTELMPLVTPQTFPACMQGMEYMDSIRENRTGTNRYFTGSDQNSLNKTASGIAQLTSSASQRVELMARVIANGMRELFRIVHELTLKHARMEEVVQLRGEWVPIDPRQWKKRTDMTISVGLAVGNREQLAANLMKLIQVQVPALQMGVANPQNLYHSFSQLANALGFANGEKFFSDPSKQPPRPPKPDPALVKAEMDNKTKLQINQQDNAVDLEKQARDQAFQVGLTQLEAALKPEKEAA